MCSLYGDLCVDCGFYVIACVEKFNIFEISFLKYVTSQNQNCLMQMFTFSIIHSHVVFNDLYLLRLVLTGVKCRKMCQMFNIKLTSGILNHKHNFVNQTLYVLSRHGVVIAVYSRHGVVITVYSRHGVVIAVYGRHGVMIALYSQCHKILFPDHQVMLIKFLC
jgi:hypothetical protein